MEFFANLNRIAPAEFKMDLHSLQEQSAYVQARIPTYGVILLNERQTKVVCVGAVGKLGFPKGKVDENESPIACAARECW